MRFLAVILALALGQMAYASERQITVTGEGIVTAAPDMAMISIGANEQRDTARAAMDAVSTSLAAMIKRLEAAGVAKKDFQTSGLNLHRKARWDQRSEREVVEGYQASSTLRVKVRDLDALGGILSAALDDGANAMSGLQFDVQNRAPLEDQARRNAVKDAMAKAALYAEAAGVELGTVTEIRDTVAPSVQSFGASPRMMAMESAGAVPVAEGEIEARAQVTMVFSID